MIERGCGGRIINISSGNYKVGRVGCAHYCASKAAVVMLTKVLAMEVAPFKITVNSVSPGLIDVGADENTMPQKYKDAFAQQIPVGCLGLPKDVSNAVLFLASDASYYITGMLYLLMVA
jgi:3-oxoacyl-[acyl-carrier protein] reductase